MSTELDTDRIVSALDRLNQRLDALEQKVDAIGGAGGSADGALAARLADPDVQAGLEGLLDRLDKVEAMVEALGTFAERVPVLSEAAGTTAKWAWDQAESRGIDPIESGTRALDLAAKLADPKRMALADKLLDQAELLERLVEQGPMLEGLLEAAAEIDEQDLRALTQSGAALTGKLAALLRTPELSRLLDATANPTALATAEYATTALVETRGHAVEPVGPVAAFFKMRDPDVQRAVGFSLALAKRFGQLLDR